MSCRRLKKIAWGGRTQGSRLMEVKRQTIENQKKTCTFIDVVANSDFVMNSS